LENNPGGERYTEDLVLTGFLDPDIGDSWCRDPLGVLRSFITPLKKITQSLEATKIISTMILWLVQALAKTQPIFCYQRK